MERTENESPQFRDVDPESASKPNADAELERLSKLDPKERLQELESLIAELERRLENAEPAPEPTPSD